MIPSLISSYIILDWFKYAIWLSGIHLFLSIWVTPDWMQYSCTQNVRMHKLTFSLVISRYLELNYSLTWSFQLLQPFTIRRDLKIISLISMFETKCVGDNNKILVTILAILVTNIHYLFTLASGTNFQKISPTSKFSHQHHCHHNIHALDLLHAIFI